MSAILRGSGRPVRSVRLAFRPPSSQQPQVGDDKGNDEVARGLDPRDRGCIAADDHVGLVDQRQNHAHHERDSDRTAQVLASQTDPQRLLDGVHSPRARDCHPVLLTRTILLTILVERAFTEAHPANGRAKRRPREVYLMDVVFLIGRILFVVPFVLSGLTNHFSRQGVEYARNYGAPAPGLMVPLSGAAIVAGGLSVALGIWADLGALVLAAFALAILPIMHAFWKEEDAQAQQGQMVNFIKNVSMAGGALVIFYVYNQLQGAAELSITDPLFGRAD